SKVAFIFNISDFIAISFSDWFVAIDKGQRVWRRMIRPEYCTKVVQGRIQSRSQGVLFACASASRTAARNFSSLNGFMKKAIGPIAMAVARAARSSRAVMTMTGGRGENAHIRVRVPRAVTPSNRMAVTT